MFCHIYAGISIELQLPEYSALYKQGHPGLKLTAITDTLTFMFTFTQLPIALIWTRTHTHTLYKHPDCTLTLRHLCSVLVFTSCYQAFWIVIVYLVLDCLPGLPGTWFLLLLDLVYAVC